MLLERCNRCCSLQGVQDGDKVMCTHCGFTQTLEIWQLFGWRCIVTYPPHYSGSIYVWGSSIGRKEANWDIINNRCSEQLASHWLRVPDPNKQINM